VQRSEEVADVWETAHTVLTRESNPRFYKQKGHTDARFDAEAAASLARANLR
jgi:hypothetical protein